ncbi:aspartate kinase [Alkalithermobacter thermoalcaliphilus JW-YL-7 = DSM 7308]|uniref:Aspartokinase n=1 Tax=Alkalithermobacter thermoalcaliphilus JW-YL-7 = DSM 7308 TaxID=1121328 RepID=A0A150FQD8_CLOPD|nr:aspartate kinase [[Clostridium] paradoxum JW-YL-7 = DSM 7308]SHK59260.1 aspartate kinase [[Clostridium] paradoxum JW-YL-7 = DSM 7308]
MNILVQKFGGTSVESHEKMLVVSNIIKQAKDKGHNIVVVVSAMGRKGAPYATDTLIQLCKQTNNSISERELDLIMSCGEIISGCVLVHTLKKVGIDSILLTGAQAGIITDDKHTDASVIQINPERILKELRDGKVVVVTGFQGATLSGEITTLGRGGSDTTAVVLGAGLNVDVVEIYTDVDGIMTADPKIESNAKVIKNINYDEVFQMADKGAKVIHPRAVEIAKNNNITIKIKNTFNPGEGTDICSYKDQKLDIYKLKQCKNLITAIAHKNEITQISIKDCQEDIFTEILSAIEINNISIDMINFFIKEKVFVIDSDKIDSIKSILESYNVNFNIIDKCSKVTLIGSNITGIPGVMAKIAKCLCSNNIPILQTSDSHMTISILIRQDDVKSAVNSLHKEFNLSEEIN